MEPCIEVVGSSIEVVKTSMDSTETSSFLELRPLASTNFHRLPVASTKSPYACISYHELQALPSSGWELVYVIFFITNTVNAAKASPIAFLATRGSVQYGPSNKKHFCRLQPQYHIYVMVRPWKAGNYLRNR